MTAQQDENQDDQYDELISLQDASSYSGLSAESLKTYANQERLRAKKIAGVWLTTRRWVDEYLQSRDPRGSKKTGSH